MRTRWQWMSIRWSFWKSCNFTNPIFCLCDSTICCLQSVFDVIYCIIHYILNLFISSRSLLKLSCIFSILVSRIFICDFILISRFGSFSLSLFRIIYQVDSLSLPLLFRLVGIYPVPLPAGYSSVSSSCLYWWVWGVLSVFWQFVKFSLLWSFLAVGGVVQAACQGFLVREACVSVLVGGAGFLLSGVQWSVQ